MKKIKKIPIKKKPAKKVSLKKIPIKKKPAKKIIVKNRVSLISKIVKLQHSLKPEFNFKINFSLEKYIQEFFDIFANKILEYKILKVEEKRKRKLEEIEKKEKEKILIYKQKINLNGCLIGD